MRISDWSSDVCSSDLSHRAGIGTAVGFGEAEASDQLAAGQFRNIGLLLRLAAEGEDRMDDQRCLDAHRRAIARIDALDLARDQPVGDMAEPRTAETLGHHCAERSEEHTSELQSLMRNSYAVFCLK